MIFMSRFNYSKVFVEIETTIASDHRNSQRVRSTKNRKMLNLSSRCCVNTIRDSTVLLIPWVNRVIGDLNEIRFPLFGSRSFELLFPTGKFQHYYQYFTLFLEWKKSPQQDLLPEKQRVLIATTSFNSDVVVVVARSIQPYKVHEVINPPPIFYPTIAKFNIVVNNNKPC